MFTIYLMNDNIFILLIKRYLYYEFIKNRLKPSSRFYINL